MSLLLNKRLEVGHTIVAPLRALEVSLDRAIGDAGKLMAAMASGRVEAKVGAGVGADAFDQLAEAVAALFRGRRAAVECHQKLETVRDDLNIPTRAYGDGSDKPPAPMTTGSNPLRIAG